MAFALSDHMAKMRRRYERGEKDGQPTSKVIASRVYPTTQDDLWDALTSAERLSRWFLPVTGDLRLGGRYQFQGNAGGTVEVCEKPDTIGVTWEYGGGVSWVALFLEPEGDGTRLELVHEAHVMPGFSEVYGPGAVGVGWDLGLMGLARHVEEPDASATPIEQTEWATSPEALEMYRASAMAWGRAAAEAGEPEEGAMAAAERTRAFYSGEATPGMGGEG